MTPVIKPVEARRLYQLVADRIRAAIQQGGFPAGSRLPPERELALQLGVSRPSLREALLALEFGGEVEVRMGSGVYVCRPLAQADQATPTLGESPSELMQARVALESGVVLLAAARVTAEGLLRLRESLDAMHHDHAKGQVPLDSDRRFHMAIAEMTGNSVLVRLVGELFDGRHGPIASRLTARSENMQTWRAAAAEHEAIYGALESRDPLASVGAMCSHLQTSQDRWAGGAEGRPLQSADGSSPDRQAGAPTPHRTPLAVRARA